MRRVLIRPLVSNENVFVNNFSSEIMARGNRVSAFDWPSFSISPIVILHWPNEFFRNDGVIGNIKLIAKLLFMRLTQIILGYRYVWVAHNSVPHEVKRRGDFLLSAFMKSLDGVIFLSKKSEELILSQYNFKDSAVFCVTVHGHYRGSMVQKEGLRIPVTKPVKALAFGQVRRYKNLDLLARIFSTLKHDTSLVIAGMCGDDALAAELNAIASRAPSVELLLTDVPIDDLTLERMIDGADCVILPYKDILNSGSVLFALSRNRPVLAPATGSLPEVQRAVGSEWLVLYEGELNEEIVLMFAEHVCSMKEASCDLSEFSWSRVGGDIESLVERL